jgi:hypothetical protein
VLILAICFFKYDMIDCPIPNFKTNVLPNSVKHGTFMKVYYIDLILYFDYSVTLNKLGMGQSIISYLKKQIANINTKITAYMYT